MTWAASRIRLSSLPVQAVLPGAIATDFWADAGTPVEHLPQEIAMSTDDMVDAALAGLDRGALKKLLEFLGAVVN